jgi:hypothetical protein
MIENTKSFCVHCERTSLKRQRRTLRWRFRLVSNDHARGFGCVAVWALVLGLAPLPWQGTSAAGGPGPDAKDKAGWKALLDGKSLAGWTATRFGGEGEVSIEGGAVILEQGNDMTGITYTRGDFPRMDYEVTLDAKRLVGNDFFCTTTFPVGDSFCSLVVGGWGGAVVGVSSINDRDASENETRTVKGFKREQWYRVRIRVTAERIQAWIDKDKVVDVGTRGKKLSVRSECKLCQPFGIATWRTTGAVRDVRVRALAAAAKK